MIYLYILYVVDKYGSMEERDMVSFIQQEYNTIVEGMNLLRRNSKEASVTRSSSNNNYTTIFKDCLNYLVMLDPRVTTTIILAVDRCWSFTDGTGVVMLHDTVNKAITEYSLAIRNVFKLLSGKSSATYVYEAVYYVYDVITGVIIDTI